MSPQELRKRVETEADFVNLKRFNYSLEKLLERYPEGCPNRVIAHALDIAEDEVEELYQMAVCKLRVLMGV